MAPLIRRKHVHNDNEQLKHEKASDSYNNNTGSKAKFRGINIITRALAIPRIYSGQIVLILVLIFGGCCSNVFTLEVLTNRGSNSGPGCAHLITFCQFLLVSIKGYIQFFDANGRYWLKPRTIPISCYVPLVVLYFLISVLTNYALEFDIPMSVHIILKSSGAVATMIVGLARGKRYTIGEVLSILTLTIGIIITTFAKPNQKKNDQETLYMSSMSSETNTVHLQWSQSWLGILMLLVSVMLSPLQGLLTEANFAKYGNDWSENLFYTNLLSLVLFAPFMGKLKAQFIGVVGNGPFIDMSFISKVGYIDGWLQHTKVSKQLIYLTMNIATQYFCITGVNMLAASVGSLEVAVVLNLRKFTSLMLSIWLFHSGINYRVIGGSLLVFMGTMAFAVASRRKHDKIL